MHDLFICLFIYLFGFFWLINLYTYPLLVSLLVLFHLFIWSFMRKFKSSIYSNFILISCMRLFIYMVSIYYLSISFISFYFYPLKNIISYHIYSIYQYLFIFYGHYFCMQNFCNHKVSPSSPRHRVNKDVKPLIPCRCSSACMHV